MNWIRSAHSIPERLTDVLIAHHCEVDDLPIVETAYLSKTGQWFTSGANQPIKPPRYWQPMPVLPADMDSLVAAA